DGTGFRRLHSFSSSPHSNFDTNVDGFWPPTALILSGSTLYGTTQYGGSGGAGVVFMLNTNGTDFTPLHSFAAYTASTTNSSGWWTNADGIWPGHLIISGNTLYGTAGYGGSLGGGTVFKLNTDGSGFTTLYNFPDASPDSSGIYTNTDGF